MSTYYTVTVPVEGRDGKTRFRRVGVMFQQKDGSKSAFNIKLDFPIGAPIEPRLAHRVAEEEHQARLEKAADAGSDAVPASPEAGEDDTHPQVSDPDTPNTVTHDQPPMFAKRVADDWHADGDGQSDEALSEAIKHAAVANQVKLTAFDARMNSKIKAA
mgnify:CR=1 FL=1